MAKRRPASKPALGFFQRVSAALAKAARQGEPAARHFFLQVLDDPNMIAMAPQIKRLSDIEQMRLDQVTAGEQMLRRQLAPGSTEGRLGAIEANLDRIAEQMRLNQSNLERIADALGKQSRRK